MVYRFLRKKREKMAEPLSWGAQLGMQAAGGVQDALLGLALEGHNDRRQIKQQGKLLEQQAAVDRRQTAYNQQIGLDTWRKTGPVAMTEELKKAGLSPALQYGMAGAGGQSVGSGGSSVDGAKAPGGGGEVMGMAMMKAQMDLIRAQTKNVEVETENKAGVDRELKGAQAGLTTIQGELAGIEARMKTDTYEATKAAIEAAAKKAAAEAYIADETKRDRVDIVEGELIGLTLANELKRAQTGVAEETIKKIIAEVKMGWKNLDIQAKNAAAHMMSSEAAKQNANTNVREFLEHVRKTDYDYEIRRGALELERWLKDVPESTKLTVGALSNVLGTVQKKATKQEK